MAADGLFSKSNSQHPPYFKDHGNIFDFTIVVTGTIEVVLVASGQSGVGLTALRALRALRVLKIMKGLENIRFVMSVIILALPSVATLFILGVVVLVFYITTATQLYAGVLDRACYWVNGTLNGTQVAVRPCGTASTAHQCGHDQQCFSVETLPDGWPAIQAPFNGTISFNNAGLSYYAVFIIGTMEGWSAIQEALDDAVGGSFNWLFTTTLVIFGGYIFVSMLIGTLTAYYVKRSEFLKHEAIRKWRALGKKVGSGGSMFRRFSKDGRRRSKKSSIRSTRSLKVAGNKPGVSAVDAAVAETDNNSARTVINPTFRRDNPIELDDSWVENLDGAFYSPDPTEFMGPVEKVCFKIFRSRWMFPVSMAVTLINTVVLCLDKFPETTSEDTTACIINYVCIGFFVCESAAAVTALGFAAIFEHPQRAIDLCIAFGAVFELVLVDVLGIGIKLNVSIFRSWRLLWVMKLFPAHFAEVKRIGRGQLKALQSIWSLLLLILTFLVIMALLGMQIFGGKFWSRTNFDSFGDAFIANFQLTTCENWDSMLAEGIEATGGPSKGGFSGMFFVFVVAAGHYVLFGLVVAIAYQTLAESLPPVEAKTLTKEELLWQAYRPEQKRSEVPSNKALYLFSANSSIRKRCFAITVHPWFDRFILVCICLASIALAVEDYTPASLQIGTNGTANDDDNDSGSSRNDILWYFDVVFTGIFVIECMIKNVAFGFVVHKESYLRNPWNVLDFVIVVTSVLAIIYGDVPPGIEYTERSAFTGLKALRAFRVLRPLRAVNQIDAMKKVVETMLITLRDIWGIVLSACVFVLCFAVIGVALFKGRFGSCTDLAVGSRHQCNGTFSMIDKYNVSYEYDRRWDGPYLNFNTVPKALEMLSTLSTFEEWPSAWHTAADTHPTKTEHGLEKDQRGVVFLYFFSYLTVVALFFVNVVMAFVVIKYEKQNQHRWIRTGLTGRQAECLKYALCVSQPCDQMVSVRHTNLFKMVTSRQWQAVRYTVVVLNVIALLIHRANASGAEKDIFKIVNVAFTGLHCLETVVNMVTFGMRGFWSSKWNRFDVFLAVGSIADAIIEMQGYGCPECGLRIFRAARVGKLLQVPRLRSAFSSFVNSFKQASWVLAFTGLIYFIYAVVGMNLFSHIEVGDIDDSDIYEHSLNARTNFQDLPSALRTLFRSMTGENWPALMAECSNEIWHAPAYYISFVLVTNLLLVNVMVAVIMSSFEGVQVDQSQIQISHLRQFATKWKHMDPDGTGFIHYEDLVIILKAIEPPIGLGGNCPKIVVDQFLSKLPVPIDEDGLIAFRPTLVAIIRVKTNLWLYDFPPGETLRDTFEFIAPGAPKQNLVDATPDTNGMTLRVLHTVHRLQHIYRQKKAAKVAVAVSLEKALSDAHAERQEQLQAQATWVGQELPRKTKRRTSTASVESISGFRKPERRRRSVKRGSTAASGKLHSGATAGERNFDGGLEALAQYADQAAQRPRKAASINLDEIVALSSAANAPIATSQDERTEFGFGDLIDE